MPVSVDYRSPIWRFVVTTADDSTVISWLDRLAAGRNLAFILNGAAVWNATVPSDNPEVNRVYTDGEPSVAEGVRAIVGFRREVAIPEVDVWTCRYHGTLLQVEDVAESDIARTAVTAYDPWQLLYSRPVRGPGTDNPLPGEDGLSFTATKANIVAAKLLQWTIEADGPVHIDAGAIYGGTAFYDGDFDDCPEIDINFQQGTMVGEAWDQLVALGVIDIILSPIWDPANRPGYQVQMNTYPLAGSQVDTALFGWDKTPRSVVGVTDLFDGTARANQVQYYYGQGGPPVTLAEDAAAVTKYGVYFAQQFFPGQNVPAAVEALAEAEVALRATGQQTLTISPAPERAPSPFTEYFLGDTVPVAASNRLRGVLAGYQRVYGIPIEISDDALETVRQLLASPQTGAV